MSKPVSKSSHQNPFNSSGTSPTVLSVEPFITAKDIAARLHIKTSTVYEWTRRRAYDERIPHYPISRKVLLFRWSEVAQWVEGKRAA